MAKLQLRMVYAFTSVSFFNPSPLGGQPQPDWLVTPLTEPTQVTQSEHGTTLILSNGLIERSVRLSSNAATVALDSFLTGESKIARLTTELREQTKQSAKLDKLKWANLKDIGSGG